MSRIGKMPIEIPSGVEVKITPDNLVEVKGNLGTLSEQIDKNIKLTMEDGQLMVERPNDSIQNRSMHGLYRTLIQNMVVGVTEGYSKGLEIIGVGYRFNKEA